MDILIIARRRWPWVLLCTAALVGLGVYYTSSQAPKYEATARVLLADNASERALDPGSQNTGFLSREMSNELSLADGDPVRALVQAELGLLPDVAITPENEADILLFRASASSAEDAARYANTWASQYVAVKQAEAVAAINAALVSQEEQLASLDIQQTDVRSPLEVIRQRIRLTTDPDTAARLQQDYDLLADDLRYELDLIASQAAEAVTNINELRVLTELAQSGEATIVQQADLPTSSANAPLARTLVVVGLLGAILGIGLAVMIDNRDETVKVPADVIAATGRPVLAALPRMSRSRLIDLPLSILKDPQGLYADEIHKARSSLEFLALDKQITSIVVTGANAAEGTSTVASNLALALSSTGTRTVLVDINYRRPAVHLMYGVDQEPGLSELVRREVEASKIAHEVEGEASQDLLIVPSGQVPPSAAAFVAQNGFLKTLSWMGSQAEVVVIDAPPLLEAPESHTLSRQADVVVLVAFAGRTTESELAESVVLLEQMGTTILGVVLVGAPHPDGFVRRVRKRMATSTSIERRMGTSPSLGPSSANYGYEAEAIAPPRDSRGNMAASGSRQRADSFDRSDGEQAASRGPDTGGASAEAADGYEYFDYDVERDPLAISTTSDLVPVNQPLPPMYPSGQPSLDHDVEYDEDAVTDLVEEENLGRETGFFDQEDYEAEEEAEQDEPVDPEEAVAQEQVSAQAEPFDQEEAIEYDELADQQESSEYQEPVEYAESIDYEDALEYEDAVEYEESFDDDGELLIVDLDGLAEEENGMAPGDDAALVIVAKEVEWDDAEYLDDDDQQELIVTQTFPIAQALQNGDDGESLGGTADGGDDAAVGPDDYEESPESDELIAIDLDQLTDEFLQVTERQIPNGDADSGARAGPHVGDYRS